jgi:enediyne biosynthesis protein E4
VRGSATLLLLFAAASGAPFENRASGSGVSFVLRNASTPEKHLIETMPGGVALFDYDGDGRLDIYFANGAPQPSLKKSDRNWSNRLFRNLGDWKFEDVTEASGTAGTGYSFGVAVADYDNDGRSDLFVAGMPSHLFRNRGDGTFEDVTARAGVSNRQQWPVGAVWFDYDRDGHVDLLVVNYVRWDPASEPFCGDTVARKYRTYCHPKHYSGLPNTLFRNNGDGTFTDVSERTGILKHVGKGMGAAVADYDGDGDVDIFIANDAVPNFLFRNDGGVFREVAEQAGVAMNDDGRALSSMGADFRDIDGDGLPDLFVTALANETYPLYRNLGKGLFLDVTYPSRIGAATLAYSGWGTAIADFDNDGRKDIFAANGDVQDNTEQFSSRTSRQRNMLLMQNADGTFRPLLFGDAGLHRGAAFGDIDGDGGIDAVVTRLNEPAALLHNTSVRGNWVAFRVPLGTEIRITAGGRQQSNQATSAVGYASSSDPAVHFGLGLATAIDTVQVRWPSGKTEAVDPPKINSVVSLQPR